MNGKHVSVASIKQKITGHKILCIVMAIMLCMLMVPRGLAFAGDNSKSENAKEVQKTEKTDKTVDPAKEVKPTEESSKDASDSVNTNGTLSGHVYESDGTTLVTEGGKAYFVYALKDAQGQVNIDFLEEDIDANGKFAIDYDFGNDSYEYGILIVTAKHHTTDATELPTTVSLTQDQKFDLDPGANVENGHLLNCAGFSIDALSTIDGYTIGDITQWQDIPLGRTIPLLGLPVGSEFGINELGQFEYVNESAGLDLLINAIPNDGYIVAGWNIDNKPFVDPIKITDADTKLDSKKISPVIVKDVSEKIAIDGFVYDELGNPVPGAYVGYISYSEEGGIDGEYVETDAAGYYKFVVNPGYYVFAATDLETGYDITEPDLYVADEQVDFMLHEIAEGALVYFNNDNPDIDHYDFSIYVGEGDDIENMIEVPEAAFSYFEIPVWFLFAGSEVYTLGGFALGFKTTLDLEILGLGEVSLGLVCEPVMKDGIDRLPYFWTITDDSTGEVEVVPWLDGFEVEDSDSFYEVDLVTAGVGYVGVEGTEGLNHFNFGLNISGEDIELDEPEVPGLDDLPLYADEELGIGQVFYVTEDGILCSTYEDDEMSGTISLEPEALPGYEFSHWVAYEDDGETYEFEPGDSTWISEQGEHIDFEAVFTPIDDKGGDKDSAHGVAQTGDALPFALVGGIALIALASLGVALYSRKRFDA